MGLYFLRISKRFRSGTHGQPHYGRRDYLRILFDKLQDDETE